MRLRLFLLTPILSLLAVAGSVAPAHAQTDYYFVPTGTQNYNADPNWLELTLAQNFVPTSGLNERAVIDNGAIVQVTDTPPTPAALTIGSTRAAAPPVVNGGGTLRITSTGTLNVVAGSLTNGAVNIGSAGSGTVQVMAGGTLTSTGALGMGPDATDILIVGEASLAANPKATLTVPAASLNGRTQVFPNANFSTTSNAVFGVAGVYTSEVNTTGTGRVTVGDIAVLNGTARLNFTGVTPTVGGPAFTILEADEYAGNFASVTSNAAVAFNQVFVPSVVDVGGGRKQLRVGLQESIVLEVDRDSGAAKFVHPGSTGIAFDSYVIGSAAGSLVPGNFNGLDDNNLFGGNWLETSTTANNIAELKPTTTATYTPGTTTPLGNIYNAFSGAFGGASEEDLQFSFSRFSDGAVIPAVIKYTGSKVNNLLLQVDPTGAEDSYLRNTSQTTVQIDGYDIQSVAGRISPANWTSLDDSNVGGADVWVEGLNNTANLISEFNQSLITPSLTLNPGDNFNLGKLFLGGTQDLNFRYLAVGQQTVATGAVIYEAFTPAAAVAGDYNENGIVDAADYTLWRNNLNGPSTALKNRNPLNSGNINQDDYAFWKSRFGATSGAGAISGGSPVPEPATWIMIASMLGLALSSRRSVR